MFVYFSNRSVVDEALDEADAVVAIVDVTPRAVDHLQTPAVVDARVGRLAQARDSYPRFQSQTRGETNRGWKGPPQSLLTTLILLLSNSKQFHSHLCCSS